MASNVKTNDDIKKIIEWIEAMRTKGIFHSSTASNRIKALNSLASILGGDEPKDPKLLLEGLDDIVDRWARKTRATPTAVVTTKSHAKGLLSDYIKYQEDPAGFKPRRRGEKAKKEKAKAPKAEKKKFKKEPKAEPDLSTELQHPSLNINIQIHISAETSEKQIDKIFESMAKYIPFKKT